MNTRAIAADILTLVVRDGRSLTGALEEGLQDHLSPKDRTFIQAVCYGVLRFYWRLNSILGALTRKPIKDDRIRMITLIGLYQIGYMRVAEHAAVSETVSAVLDDVWAKPLVNGILRNYQRNRETLDQQVQASPSLGAAHPQWLYDKLRRDWPKAINDILHENNGHPPMTLRVNLLRQSREAFVNDLEQAGFAGTPNAIVPSAVTLEQATGTDSLPGFSAGQISVQDAAAQIAPTLLDLQPGLRILDLCAAPGGKSCHILETCPDIKELVAVDIDEDRLERVQNNLDRLGLKATLLVGDALEPATWWDGHSFDRILVDAPCSATGVIRRHPDIKLLRKPQDISQLAKTQQAILNATWPLLADQGRLLYATCSVLRQENSDVIDEFLKTHPDAEEVKLDATFGLEETHGRQILPGMDGMDGFYYAALIKHAS